MTATTTDDVTLPPALRGLAPELAQLAPDVVAALQPLLARLLAALSTSSPAVIDDDGEPDGHRGFVRRGPWSRLVLSEWALLDEVPDEFLRRVAAGEQLFHELERTQPRAPGAVVVLFDVGGDQLGRCHLVQLAIAIVLAARARERGATLLCGVLSTSTTTKLLRPFSAALLVQLQQARARDAVDVVACDAVAVVVDAAIAERLGPHARRDVVVIGGARTMTALSSSTAPLWQRAQRVVLQDAYTPEAAVTLTTSTTAAKTVTLPLPDDATCTRLLRDPLQRRPNARSASSDAPPLAASGRRKRKHVAIDVEHALILSIAGDRVLTRLVDGDIVSLAVPQRAHSAATWGRTLSVREPLVAVGARGRLLEALVCAPDGRCAIVDDSNHRSLGVAPIIPSIATPCSFGRMLTGAGPWQPFVDLDKRLFVVDRVARSVRFDSSDQMPLTTTGHDRLLHLEKNEAHTVVLSSTSSSREVIQTIEGKHCFDASTAQRMTVVCRVDGAWTTWGRQPPITTHHRVAGGAVAGVWVTDRVALITQADEQTLKVVSNIERYVSLPAPILRIVVATATTPQAIVLTADGGISTVFLSSLTIRQLRPPVAP